MLRATFLLALATFAAAPAQAQVGDPADDGAPDALAPLAPDDELADDPADDTAGPDDDLSDLRLDDDPPAGDRPPGPGTGAGRGPADPADGPGRTGKHPTTAEIERWSAPSVVRLRADLTNGRRRFSSGVFVGPREVATTASALYDAERVEVDLGGDPRPFVVDGVVAIDEALDLAVVVLRERDVGSRPIALAASAPPAGTPVWSVTFPEQRSNSRPEVAAGAMLAPTPRGTLQIDVPVVNGAAGGALVNARGELAALLLPGEGPAGAALAAEVDELRMVLRDRHRPVPLAQLDAFLDDRAAEGAYTADGYSTDDDYVDTPQDDYVDDDDDNRTEVACALALCTVAPPLAVGLGVGAAFTGICAVYGCAACSFFALTFSRVAFAVGLTGAAVGTLAGGLALGALAAGVAPLLLGAGVGLAALGMAGVAAALGATALGGGAAMMAIGLSDVSSGPSSPQPFDVRRAARAAARTEQGLALAAPDAAVAASTSGAVRY